jgi:hypothetical protein
VIGHFTPPQFVQRDRISNSGNPSRQAHEVRDAPDLYTIVLYTDVFHYRRPVGSSAAPAQARQKAVESRYCYRRT